MMTLKERIQAGEVVNGCWLNLGSVVSAEIVARAGFDWVLIDLEHGGAGNDVTMFQQLQVISASSSVPIVRTDELSRGKVQRILDAGASGIMFPQIQSVEEAAHAAKMMYYPPRGVRGMAKMIRATGFGRNTNDYVVSLERNIINVIQVETVNAVKQIDAIAATPGVDVLFVGPSDLSLALGVFGQLDHPTYQQAIKDVAQAARKHGKAAGVLLWDPSKEFDMYHQLGFRFLACGADGSFVVKGADEMIKNLKSLSKK
jgi:4-hydroxy-2-oxoheptanedioate aldolase